MQSSQSKLVFNRDLHVFIECWIQLFGRTFAWISDTKIYVKIGVYLDNFKEFHLSRKFDILILYGYNYVW